MEIGRKYIFFSLLKLYPILDVYPAQNMANLFVLIFENINASPAHLFFNLLVIIFKVLLAGAII